VKVSNSKLLVVTLVTATVVVATAYFAWIRQRRLISEQPLIVTDVNALNIGRVWAQSDFKHSLLIANAADFDVHVRNIKSSCACLKIDPCTFTLSPGDSRQLNMTLDLQPRRGLGTNGDAIPFSVQLVPKVDAIVRHPISWMIIGQIQRALAVDPPVIDFGKLIIGEAVSHKSITVRCLIPVDNISIAIDLPGAKTSVQKLRDDEFELDIALSSQLDKSFDTTATISAMSKQGTKLSDIVVPVSGVVLPKICVQPDQIAVGLLSVGQTAERQIMLRPVSSNFKCNR
jgi:hypothetical protein